MNEYTLEKLKIAEKLDTVNTTLIALKENHESVKKLLEKHEYILYGNGNGKPGITIRIDRLEQIEDDRRWHFRALWTGVLALVAKVLHLTFR